MLWKPLNVVVKSMDVQQLGMEFTNYCGNKVKRRLKASANRHWIIVRIPVVGRLC